MASTKFTRIAIIGASGQLGSELTRRLGSRAIPIRHWQLELTDLASVNDAFAAAVPDFVINTAAYNWVDKAEDEPAVAYAVNGLGPRNLAMACQLRGIPMLHVSSDYVFGWQCPDTASDPLRRPLREADIPGPQGAYAISKLAGEYFVRTICPQHFVVRTCGLYGDAETPGKGNFVKTMLRLGRERGTVRVVADQHCTPTSASDLAAAMLELIETTEFGLYHLTNDGATTWFDFAREIFRIARLKVVTDPITTQEFGARAPRPSYSVLNCEKAAHTLQMTMPSWQSAVERYLTSLHNA